MDEKDFFQYHLGIYRKFQIFIDHENFTTVSALYGNPGSFQFICLICQ